MFAHWPLLLLLPLLPVPLVQADPALRLHHRVHDPTNPVARFTPRATLSLSGSGPGTQAHLAPTDTLEADLLEFAHIIQHNPRALYQLALEHPGDVDQSQWHISTVKACHLSLSTSEDIILHLAQDGTPYALDYFVGPIPHDGSCPKIRRRGSSKAGPGASESAPALRHVSNTTVSVVHPRFPPLPQLRTPPPLTPEGKPLEAVPEKTFLQKYWLYFLIAIVAILVTPGGEEEGAGSGGAKAGGAAGKR